MSATAMASRGLQPVARLAADRPHGDRLRYMAGCRCKACRAANSAYENERSKARAAGDWNGIVLAKKSRKHIEKLSAAGVGRRAISAASDVALTVITDIKAGAKTQIRARTERRILAVTPAMASDHALVDATATWRLIDALVAAGFTKGSICLRLGNKTPNLQLSKDRVLVKHAAMIQRIHRELLDSDLALIDARPSCRLIEALIAEGWTEKQIARHLGFADGELAVGKKKISRGLAKQIETTHARLTA